MRLAIRLWVISLMSVALAVDYATSASRVGCTPVSTEDILEAAHCSDIIYEHRVELKPGDRLWKESKYNVIEEVDLEVQSDRKRHVGFKHASGEHLKAIIAQTEGEGPSTMFCFMGTASTEQLNKQSSDWNAPWSCMDRFLNEKPCPTFAPGETKKKKHYNRYIKAIFKYDWDTYKRLEGFIKNKLYPLIKNGSKYIFSGHSLGGALATILALKMTRKKSGDAWGNKNTALITFGSPRVFSVALAKMFDATVPKERSLRFIYRKDSVPQVPPSTHWYQHISREIYITNKFTKDWRRKGNNDVIVCPTGDTNECGNYWSRLWGLSDDDDHGMTLYLNTISKLYNDKEKRQQFELDQCEEGKTDFEKRLEKASWFRGLNFVVQIG